MRTFERETSIDAIGTIRITLRNMIEGEEHNEGILTSRETITIARIIATSVVTTIGRTSVTITSKIIDVHQMLGKIYWRAVYSNPNYSRNATDRIRKRRIKWNTKIILLFLSAGGTL